MAKNEIFSLIGHQNGPGNIKHPELVGKGPVNIYGNTGPGNERWPVVKFAVAPLILPYKIVYGPVFAWSKIFHGPVEISFQNKS